MSTDNSSAAAHHGDTQNSLADEVRALVWTLLRRIHIIFLVAFLTLAGVLGYIWTTTPLFSSKVEILIDPREQRTVGREVTPTGLGTSAVGADTLLLESQIELLQSQKVADALINWENLTEDPEFAGGEATPLIEAIKNIVKTVVYGPQQTLWKKMSAYDRVLAKLAKRVTVERERNTYVISVTVESKEAEKAARLANRLAWIYIAEVNQAASSRTREAATLLDSKLEELRQAANKAAAAVETYRQQNNLIDANQTLVVEQQLGDLNRNLSGARTELETTRARRNQVQAAIASGDGSSIRPGEIGVSTVMSSLQTRLADLEGQEASLKLVYLPSHPTIRGVRERISAVKTSLKQEYSRILNRLDVAYKTAQEKAASLQREVAKLETEMAASNADKVELRELEREAAATRTVYESFLQRSKEAREQIDIPSSTAQVISRAFAASKPGHPPVRKLLLAGAALGILLGILIALLHSALKRPAKEPDAEPAVRAPEQPVHEQPVPVAVPPGAQPATAMGHAVPLGQWQTYPPQPYQVAPQAPSAASVIQNHGRVIRSGHQPAQRTTEPRPTEHAGTQPPWPGKLDASR